MARQAQLEGCFCSMADSTVRPLLAVCMGAELFSNSHRQQLGNGISEGCILFTANPTAVFLMAPYFALVPARSTAPPITVVKTVSALFTSYRPGRLGNGTVE